LIKMRISKKILAIALSILMAVSMMPFTVFAADEAAEINGTKYETFEAAWNAAVDGDTITLLKDSAGNGLKAPQGKYTTGLTVNFDGYTYTVDGSLVGSTGTETQAFQLLKDNKITFENGTIYSSKAKMLIQNYSNLTLDNMTLTLDNPSYAYAYTLSNNNGNVVIEDTEINANPAGGFAFDVCRYASYPSVNVTVKGDSVINGNVEVDASSGDAKDGFSLTLKSGELNGDISITNNGATALAADDDSEIVKEDTFTAEAPEGYEWDTTGTLVEDTHTVAKIGDAKYDTLEEAWNAAVDGDTITLVKDCNGNGLKAPQGKFQPNGLTVDFDGHTYTQDGTLVGSTGTETQAFQLLKDNNITFTNGTITSTKAKMLIQNYSNLTLDNMTLTLDNPNYAYAYTLSNNNGNVVIDDTTINANPAGGFAFDVCRYASYTGVDVTVTGNSVINGDVQIDIQNGDAKNGANLTLESGTMNGDIDLTAGAEAAIADDQQNAAVTKVSTFTQDAPEGYEWVDGETAGTQVLVEDTHTVAKIGDVKYDTLKEAFAAAVDGDTITLVQDCDGDGIVVPQGKFNTNGLTVDFNGFTYDISGNPVGSTGTETLGFQLLKDNKLTFKDGAITTSNYTNVLRVIQNYADLTLDNMTISMKGAYYNEKTVSNANGTMNIVNGSTVNAPDYSWINPSYTDSSVFGGEALTVGTFSTYTAATVNVEDSTINGDLSVDVDNPATSTNTVNLTSGTLTGDIKMLDNASADTVEVNKQNTFSQDPAQGYKWVDNNDGTSSLEKIDNGYSITVEDKISMNIYLDLDSYDADSATFTFNNNDNGDPTGIGNLTVTKTKSQLQKQVGGEYDGCYYFTIVQAPAQMADAITVNINKNGNVVDTINTSVADYLIQASASSDVDLANLAKAMYDYGKAVCTASFAMGDYVGGNNFTHAYFNEAAMNYTDVTGYVFNIDNSGSTQSANNVQFGFGGAALVATSVPTFRVMFNFTEDQWKNYYGDNCTTARCSKYGESTYVDLNLAVSEASGQVCVDLGSIMPEDFDQVYELNFDNATMRINVLGYAAAAIKTGSEMGNEDGAKIVDLGRSIYNYYVAAAAYFA
jgi:hypothetical protein